MANFFLILETKASNFSKTCRASMTNWGAELNSFRYFFVIAILFNYVWLGPLQVSIDGELAAFNFFMDHYISQGRWGAFLFQKYVMPLTCIPYLPVLLYCFFISISYLIVLRALNIAINAYSYFSFPIFCSFPTINYVLEYNTAFSGLGPFLFLTFIAFYILKIKFVDVIFEQKKIVFKDLFSNYFFVPLIILSFVLSVSQLYFLIFFVIFLSLLLMKASENPTPINCIMHSLVFIFLFFFLSLLIYFLITKIVLILLGLNVYYVDEFFSPQGWLEKPVYLLNFFFNTFYTTYLGFESLYKTPMYAAGLVFVAGLLIFLLNVLKEKRKIYVSLNLLLLIIFILVPFSVYFCACRKLPDRFYLAAIYVIWTCAIFIFKSRYSFVRICGFVLVVLLNFQILMATSAYAATREIRYNYDKFAAFSIYERIALAHDSFSPEKKYQVDFYGGFGVVNIFPSVEWATMNASFFAMDGGNINRILSFMKLLGIHNLVPPERDRKQLVPYYSDMPIWPSRGSIKVIDGITLVKLGPNAGRYD